jgi:hypothetical protein
VASIADELRADLDRLIAEGEALSRSLAVNSGQVSVKDFREQVMESLQRHDEKAKAEGKAKPKGRIADRVDNVMKRRVLDFRTHYESWYSEALSVVTQILPDRITDFRQLYKQDRRKAIDVETYTVSDYQIGLSTPRVDPELTALAKFNQQVNIVTAAKKVLASRLADIRGVLQADLFDSELDTARELLKNGFVRAAGMVAGVVLERHLAEVVRSHKVTVRSRSPTISSYNDALKNAGVLNVPRWRAIQGLADIRNLCGHAAEREPTSEAVDELIDGVEKITKSVS